MSEECFQPGDPIVSLLFCLCINLLLQKIKASWRSFSLVLGILTIFMENIISRPCFNIKDTAEMIGLCLKDEKSEVIFLEHFKNAVFYAF